MIILSYVLNVLGIALVILPSLIKGEKMTAVLVLLSSGNLLVALGYLAAGSGINGAASCFAGFLVTLINFCFTSRGRAIPIPLAAVYAVLLIGINVWVGGINIHTAIAIAACLVFIAGIFQPNGKGYRIFTILNILLWCTYDLTTKTYSALISHSIQLIFVIVGILANDVFKIKLFEKKGSEEQ